MQILQHSQWQSVKIILHVINFTTQTIPLHIKSKTELVTILGKKELQSG